MKFFYKVTTKNGKKRVFLLFGNLLEFLVLEPISRVPPCESSRPGDSENVVLFGRATFLTGVIAAQSRNMPAKLKASPQIGGVQKKSHGHNFWISTRKLNHVLNNTYI